MAKLIEELAKPVECVHCGDEISWRPVCLKDDLLIDCLRCGKANQTESPVRSGRQTARFQTGHQTHAPCPRGPDAPDAASGLLLNRGRASPVCKWATWLAKRSLNGTAQQACQRCRR
jgi:hypothetical protein